MRVRSISSLASSKESEFLYEMSEGCRHVLENAVRLLAAAEVLAKSDHGRASHALRLIAEEEGSKYLILLDAVRCSGRPASRRVAQLKRFNSHLAKGIYARVYAGRPATVGEVIRYVDTLRASHYLDGPNDVDWLFRNQIAQEREEALYVDYVETDEGMVWWTPGGFRDESRHGRSWNYSDVVTLIQALDRSGVGTLESLQVVADLWRPLSWSPEAHYQEWSEVTGRLLEVLDEAGCLRGEAPDHQRIVRSWLFPLYDVDMSPINVDIEELRTRQREAVWEW